MHGFCGIGWTFVKLRKADWLKEKKINVLFQMVLAKHPDIPHVPAILDFAKSPEDRQVIEFLFAPQDMGRPFFAPPGVPPERVAALRSAFARTLKDAGFLEDTQKQGIEVQLVPGEAIQQLVERTYASPRAHSTAAAKRAACHSKSVLHRSASTPRPAVIDRAKAVVERRGPVVVGGFARAHWMASRRSGRAEPDLPGADGPLGGAPDCVTDRQPAGAKI